MSRDPRQLKVFIMADALVLDVYAVTRQMPIEERFALQSQIRRAAVSVPTNIVEGCARRSQRDYLKFLDIALSSASEARYLVSVATRLQFIETDAANRLSGAFSEVIRYLQGLVTTVARRLEPSRLRPEA
jgi:four helix bundle protein